MDTWAPCHGHISESVVDSVSHMPSTYSKTTVHLFLLCLQPSGILCPRTFFGCRSMATKVKARNAKELIFLGWLSISEGWESPCMFHKDSQRVFSGINIQLPTAVTCPLMHPVLTFPLSLFYSFPVLTGITSQISYPYHCIRRNLN